MPNGGSNNCVRCTRNQAVQKADAIRREPKEKQTEEFSTCHTANYMMCVLGVHFGPTVDTVVFLIPHSQHQTLQLRLQWPNLIMRTHLNR